MLLCGKYGKIEKKTSAQHISAGLDVLGAIPFAGETADTARLAKLGIDTADVVKDADNAVDVARTVDKTGDVVKAVDEAEDLYTAAKVDGTIQGFLDASDDPIAEMNKMSGSIAKTSPIEIPDNAVIKPKKTGKGYYHMEYNWTDGTYKYEVRWHTKTPNAPTSRRDSWVIERRIIGKNYGKYLVKKEHKVLVGDEWIDKKIWEEAKSAWYNGNATKIQEEILKNGHWEV